jgi:hypothetical protein
MAATPEGRVKNQVRKVLKKYPHWGFWPVQMGFGRTALDYIGCIGGKFFAIETKANGAEPTDLQRSTMIAMIKAGGKVFLIQSTDDPRIHDLELWMQHYSVTHEVTS